MNSITKIAFLFFGIIISMNAFAWGMQGHRIVGEIANAHLNVKAKKEIQNILGNESVAIASNWPDFVKSDTGYKSYNVWHYIDVAPDLTFAALKDTLLNDTSPNAYNKLRYVIVQLKKKNLPSNEKLLYLRYLIHLVGDIHQPLHVSRTGDRGGNDLKVSWFGEPSNIHKVWDEQLIDYQKLSFTEYTANINFVTDQQKREWQNDAIEKWFFESYAISEAIHKDVNQGDKLGFNYNFKMYETLNRQLLKGGIRLAGILNELFGT